MLRRISLAITFSLAMAAGAWAQVSTAELVGVVTDASGASITGAKVVLTNRETNQSREAATDQLGNYIFTLIPPGIYNLSVEAAGFKKFVQNDAQLQVNQRARIDFSLQVGQVSETVEVAAAAPLLESQSSSLGS
ncbi:MAG: carboxypeptidase regulatory-like domain-containing protein, partial [Candidatus Solibacter usitatus]|nr:carboxypeptidase regulatory-like domain-containing protein [Candidatus Solibacter usitatus]